MTRKRFLISAVLLLAAGCSSPEPLTLRVLSYNIHHGDGLDRKLNLERIGRVIQESQADLVALQEVDRNTQRTGHVDQPARLAALTGMSVIFEKNIDFEGGEYGNAILTRRPVQSHANHRLPRLQADEQRGLLAARLRIGGIPVVFCATHFDAGRTDDDRLAQAAAVKQFVQGHPGEVLILAGDLNARPDSPVMAALFSVLHDTCPPGLAEALTIPADRPRARIDYILFSPHPAIQPMEYQVLSEEVASDHRPVWASLRIQPQR